MKKLYCAILLLAMPSMYGMQKKTKSHKKFNIHNAQKKSGKKSGNVTAKKKKLREEHYQLERASYLKQYNAGISRDNRIIASLFLGGPILLYTVVSLDYYKRGMSSFSLLNWCIDGVYGNTPF